MINKDDEKVSRHIEYEATMNGETIQTKRVELCVAFKRGKYGRVQSYQIMVIGARETRTKSERQIANAEAAQDDEIR